MTLEEIQIFAESKKFYIMEWLAPETVDGRVESYAMVVLKRPGGFLVCLPVGSRGGLGGRQRIWFSRDSGSIKGDFSSGSAVRRWEGGSYRSSYRCRLGGPGCVSLAFVSRGGAAGGHRYELLGGRRQRIPLSQCSPGDSLPMAGVRRGQACAGRGMVHPRTNSGERGRVSGPASKAKGKGKSKSTWGFYYRKAKKGNHSITGSSSSGCGVHTADHHRADEGDAGEAEGHGGEDEPAEQCVRSFVAAFGRKAGSACEGEEFGGGAGISTKDEEPCVVADTSPKAVSRVIELEQERQGLGPGSDLAQAMLAQSAALTSLVAQITSNHQDPLQDLQPGAQAGVRGAQGRARLQQELASQKGLFFHSVVLSMARRMAPTSVADQPYGVLLANGISGVRYLERFGGYGRQKDLGILMFQVMTAIDFLMAGNVEAAKDTVALMAVMLEQACLDGGRFELAQCLTLQEDIPASIFTSRQTSQLSRSRAFAPLADQRWITVALAFLKEMDVIVSKRGELTSTSAASAGRDAASTPGGGQGKGGPKKKKNKKEGEGEEAA